MDFEMHYSEEQEKFREEVRSWLKANIRQDLKAPCDEGKITREFHEHGMEIRRKLGKKGWLAPRYPKEYGGGGLPVEEAVIVAEEMVDYQIYLPYDSGLILAAPAIMVWGTEEQKQRYLPSILTGELITWQCFSEPEAGTDLASLKLRADKDGDDFVLNGQKLFIGNDFEVDWLYTLGITDPSKPRHANIGAFIVPADSPGITIEPMNMIAGKTKNSIFYDNVRVNRAQLIGGETDGWRVSQSTLEVEHGGMGGGVRRDRFVEQLFDVCRKTRRNGQALSKDPDVRSALVEIWMGSQTKSLFEMRNYWMRTAQVPWAWEGAQSVLYEKLRMPKVAQMVRDIFGLQALTTDPEWQLMDGEIENQQRMSIMTHGGGTPEAQKIIMARRVGITKTRQSAASIF